MRRKPPSAAAPAPTQRVGSTRWVCTSMTGALPSNASSAASGSNTARSGTSKNPPPCAASIARSVAAVPRRSVARSGAASSSCGPRRSIVSLAVAIGVRVAGPAREWRVLVARHPAEQRRNDRSHRAPTVPVAITPGGYSARSRTAVSVRAAWRAGDRGHEICEHERAGRDQRDRSAGTVGSGTTCSAVANRSHSNATR